MINIRLLWRSICGVPERHSLSTAHSSRSLFVRNRNRFPWHQTDIKSRFHLFPSDFKSRLSVTQIGLSSTMSSFTYPMAKRTDFSENLHGIAVKTTKKLILSDVSWNLFICFCSLTPKCQCLIWSFLQGWRSLPLAWRPRLCWNTGICSSSKWAHNTLYSGESSFVQYQNKTDRAVEFSQIFLPNKKGESLLLL